MKNNTKILSGFLAIIILILVMGGFNYFLQNNILENSKQIKYVETPMSNLAEQLLSYDALLTVQIESVLIHAQNGDYNKIDFHRPKYNEIKIKLDDIVNKDFEMYLSQDNMPEEKKAVLRGLIVERRDIKAKRIDLETKAFDAIERKDIETAYQLIAEGEYENYKESLYRNIADIKLELASDDKGAESIKYTQRLIYLNLGISIIIIIIIIIILFMRSFIAEQSVWKEKRARLKKH